MSIGVSKKRRPPQTEAAVRVSLATDFPFLARYEDVLVQLALWEEFVVGEFDDDIDPIEADSFALFPTEELYWRVDWRQTGLFAVASFLIHGKETSICVGVEQPLFAMRSNASHAPVVCPRALSAILNEVEKRPHAVAAYLQRLEEMGGQ